MAKSLILYEKNIKSYEEFLGDKIGNVYEKIRIANENSKIKSIDIDFSWFFLFYLYHKILLLFSIN